MSDEAERPAINRTPLFLVASIIALGYFAIVSDYLFLTAVGLAFSIFIALEFVDQLGKSYPLKHLIILIASLQWVVGAKISYEYGKIHYKYFMYVEEERYMMLVVPAILFLYAGLFVFKMPNLKARLDQAFERKELDIPQVKGTANMLFVIGLSAFVLSKLFSIPALAFVLFIVSLLIYVSIGYYFYVYPNRRTLIFALILGIAFFQALSSGMFHNFMLIGIFLFAIYVKGRTSFLKKMVIILLSLFLVNIIQVVKQDFREIVWKSKASNNVDVFISLIEKEYFTTRLDVDEISNQTAPDQEEDITKITTRLNQGWIISKIMSHIPNQQEYLDGQSIVEAISASFLPRFLFPNKTSGVDAKKIFEKATGLRLLERTAMGLSLVGEFYANFGMLGAWIGCLIYGLFVSLVIKFLTNFSGNSPFLVLWLLLIFFQVIKAESNLLSVLNHLSKSLIFLITFNYMANSILRIKLFYQPKQIAFEG